VLAALVLLQAAFDQAKSIAVVREELRGVNKEGEVILLFQKIAQSH
jgi:hypothetical protein